MCCILFDHIYSYDLLRSNLARSTSTNTLIGQQYLHDPAQLIVIQAPSQHESSQYDIKNQEQQKFQYIPRSNLVFINIFKCINVSVPSTYASVKSTCSTCIYYYQQVNSPKYLLVVVCCACFVRMVSDIIVFDSLNVSSKL